MNNNDNKLYLYTDAIDVVITTSAMYVDNLPMNKRKLIAHKGLSNEIYINVRDRDRKLQNIVNQTLRLYVINPTTRKRIITRVLEHTSEIGIVKAVLAEGDLVNTSPGLYHAYISRSFEENHDMPIYSDHNNNIRFDLEITDQTGMTPPDTQEDTSFLQVENTELEGNANISVSSAFYGNLHRNFHNAQHTAAIYPDGFTGTVLIQGSCLTSVPHTEYPDNNWFDLSTLEFSDNNQATSSSFVCNCNWIRFVITTDAGVINKVALRN